MERENELNQANLDFEKMNATLADPDFANWYYNQVSNNLEQCENFTIENFVKIINNYKLN